MSDADSIRVDAVTHGNRGWPLAAPSAQPTTSTIDREWDLLLACIAGFVLTAVGRVHELFPALNVVRPAMTTGLLSIILLSLDSQSIRRWRSISTGTTTWLVALLIWAVLSVPGALSAGHSFDFVTGEFAKTVAMAIVLACAVRGGRDVERIAAVVFWAAALYASVVLFRFDIGGDTDWRLGKLYYYDANDFATFAVASMPLGVYLARRARTWLGRGMPVIALIVISAAFVRSGSRGGFLALLATALFIVLSLRAISIFKRVAAVAVVAVVVFVAASDRYWNAMGTILSDTDYNQTAESGRLQIWKRGVGYVLHQPVFGVGPDNFQAAEGQLSSMASRQQYGVGVRWNAPHDTFLQVAAELGIPALVFFVLMMFGAFRDLHPRRYPIIDPTRRPPVPPALKQALRASLLGFVVGSLFLSLAYTNLLYTLIGLSIAVSKLERRYRRSIAAAQIRPSLTQEA
jgi:putative inorganic carbon (hco3(-)) transporter